MNDKYAYIFFLKLYFFLNNEGENIKIPKNLVTKLLWCERLLVSSEHFSVIKTKLKLS